MMCIHFVITGIYVIMLFLFPAWAIHMNTETLLIAMGQNVEVAR